MTEIKSCPFCGGEAVIKQGLCVDGLCISCYAKIECPRCGASMDKIEEYAPQDEVTELAIELWNQRAQKEKTCKMTKIDGDKILAGWWECSECGPVYPPCNDEIAIWALKKCPHCGAKVVKD